MATLVRSPYAEMVMDLVQKLGIDNDTLALAVGTDKRTVKRWLEEGHNPQERHLERLSALVVVKDHLLETFDNDKTIHRWIARESRYLGNMSPCNALRAGRIDRVEGALVALDEGTFI
jgi:uncharacterized protein (DUF2384 family)